MKIGKIHWTETIPIRHQVLWPTKPPEFCCVEGDEEAWHYGVMLDVGLVSVASLYLSPSLGGEVARLRKFATLETFQRQGIGSALLTHLLSVASQNGISYFWCDARESAQKFYARFGLLVEGERFYKENVPFVKMGKQL